MGWIKKVIIGIVALFVVAIILGALGNNNSEPPAIKPPADNDKDGALITPKTISKNFDMGFVPIPAQPIDTQAWLDVFSLMSENADFVLQHANLGDDDWKTFKDGETGSTTSIESLNFISGMSKNNNLNLFIVIDPLISDRTENNVPSTVGSNFGDTDVRTAYKNYVLRVVEDYSPKYLGLFSEINTYLNNHPEDKENVISLFDETYDLVKAKDSNIKVTATFQYETLSGISNGVSNWDELDLFDVDVVAITTYPSPFFESASDMPGDYYSKLNSHTTKPIIVAESGWPSSGPSRFNGSPEKQKEFIELFPTLMKDVDLKLWIYWFLHDQKEGYAEVFRTMGLREFDGTPKPAWNSWVEIYNS